MTSRGLITSELIRSRSTEVRDHVVTTRLRVSPHHYGHPAMAEHDYEVSCECGAQWRIRLEADDDAMATCLACGADTFNLSDLGEVHAAGRDVEWKDAGRADTQ